MTAPDTPPAPFRLGIVGYGWVARDYLAPAAARLPGVELVAVVSPNPADFADLPADIATYASADALLAAEALDGVYVATPNHLHVSATLACIASGIPVLCEKPLAHTVAEAERMVAAVEASGVAYATAFDQRFHPAHVRMRELVVAGTLGTLTHVRLDYACWVPPGWSDDNWRVDLARAGGGAIIDLAPHGLDLTETITGQRIERLTGYAQHAVHEYAVDDGGAFVGYLSGGALLVHTVGYNRPETLPRRRLEVIGTGGVLTAVDTMGQTPGGTLTFADAANGKREPVAFDTAMSPFDGQLAHFVAQVRGERAPLRSASDDLRLARLLDVAYAP